MSVYTNIARMSHRLRPLLVIALLPLVAATCITAEKDAEPTLPFQGMSYKANGKLISTDFNEMRKNGNNYTTLLERATDGRIIFSQPRFDKDSLILAIGVPYLEVPDTIFLNEVSGNSTLLSHFKPYVNIRNAMWFSRLYKGNKKTNYIIFDKIDDKERVAGRFEMVLIIDSPKPGYADTMRITEGRFNTFENIQQIP